MSTSPSLTPKSARRRIATLSGRKPTPFEVRPGTDACADIARDLGLSALSKLRFSGRLRPEGTQDWRLDGRLEARVVQPCVITLAPVTTKIMQPVARRFLAQMPDDLAQTPPGPAPGTKRTAHMPSPEQEEIEMPEDENIDPLGSEIDLWRVMVESLALEVPDYPRATAPGATNERAEAKIFAPEGIAPMRDEDVRPFAGLAALRAKLGPKN